MKYLFYRELLILFKEAIAFWGIASKAKEWGFEIVGFGFGLLGFFCWKMHLK